MGNPDYPTARVKLDHPNHRLQPNEVAALIAAYRAGAGLAELGRQFNLHEQTVRAHLERAHVHRRPQRVLSPVEVEDIIRQYTAGRSLRELGTTYGVAGSTVRNWLLRSGVELRPARRVPRQAASS